MNRCAALLFFGCALMFYADTAIAETGSQIPATTRDGKTNLTHVWLHKGGGRLYWKTLTHPLQIRLEGAQFVDPASVPVLSTNPGTDLSARQSHKKGRRSSRKSRRAQSHSQTDKAAQAQVSPAPMDAGKTALRAPSTKNATARQAQARNRSSVSSGRASPPPVTTYTTLH
ncbi:MAG: hypothetical protein J5861_03255 [Desulfovibrio sp.]|nr:hypothetical protein [Desulfovibrio sp.]